MSVVYNRSEPRVGAIRQLQFWIRSAGGGSTGKGTPAAAPHPKVDTGKTAVWRIDRTVAILLHCVFRSLRQ